MNVQALLDVCNGVHIHNLGDIYFHTEHEISLERLKKVLFGHQVGILIVDNSQFETLEVLNSISKNRSPNFRAKKVAKWSKTSHLWVVYTGKHQDNR